MENIVLRDHRRRTNHCFYCCSRLLDDGGSMTKRTGHNYVWAHGQYQGLLKPFDAPAAPMYAPSGKRYCETCQSYQPKHGKAMKGWKCITCEERT